MSLSVAVAGASGYAGGELLRLIAQHPELEVTTVTAHSNAGSPLVEHQPHLRSLKHLQLVDTTPENLAGHDVVFLALPHGASGAVAAELGDAKVVVDVGADHRLTSPDAWSRFYGGEYHGAWAYGMPELVHADGTKQRDILSGATRIAVPGCNVTAISLALAPALQAGLIEPRDLVAILAVGPSGAGRSLRTNLLASEVLGSAYAYGVGGTHRHTPEIVQNLELAGGDGVTVSFTPMLVPMARGILATSTARLATGSAGTPDLAAIRAAYDAVYGDEAFVQVIDGLPKVSDTIGANTCLVGLAVDETAGRLVAVSALDNLVKGTAGAALQSVNIALGLDETAGLSVDGVAP